MIDVKDLRKSFGSLEEIIGQKSVIIFAYLYFFLHLCSEFILLISLNYEEDLFIGDLCGHCFIG